MPDSTLQAIENKVRRLTRSPSTAQLSNADLEQYINTFVVYDFPEHLRTFNLHKNFTFYTNPYQDVYPTDKASFGDPVTNPTIVTNPLYNFQNNYLTVNPPAYIAGYQSMWSQSQQQFFGMYPKVSSIAFTGQSGDGVTVAFTGVINTAQVIIPNNFNQNIALLQRNVLFSTLDANRNGLAMVDVPVIDASTGNPTTDGNLYDPASAAYQAALATPPTAVIAANTINYATGVYTVTFAAAPGADEPINSQTVAQNLGLPQSILYYANQFVVRPVPDQPYAVTFEVAQRPTELLATDQSPELEEYWQLIALGASIKIFQDRMDMDSVQLVMPEFRNQMNLCNRRTLVQLSNQRTATIYTEQVGLTSGGFGWGSGGSNT